MEVWEVWEDMEEVEVWWVKGWKGGLSGGEIEGVKEGEFWGEDVKAVALWRGVDGAISVELVGFEV